MPIGFSIIDDIYSHVDKMTINNMTENELLQHAELIAQDMERRKIIQSDELATYRARSTQDADLYAERWGTKIRNLRYVQYFAGNVKTAWRKYLVALLASPDWYTKVTLQLTDDNRLTLIDLPSEELQNIYHTCNKRIDKLLNLTDMMEEHEEDSDQ